MRLELKEASLDYQAGTPFAVTAIDAVSLTVEPGERLGIIGPAGAGKSSLLELLAGVTAPGAGQVLHDGIEPRRHRPGQIGLAFQEPERCLFENTVFADVAFGPRRLGLAAEEVEERVDEALARVGLDSDLFRDRSPLNLSAGEQRRVALAGVLALKPGVLILDEPAASLDLAARRDLYERLGEINREEGTTVVVASHDMDEMAGFAGRLLVLDGGRLVADGPPAELLADEERLAGWGLRPPLTVRLSGLLAATAGVEVSPALNEDEALAALVAVMERGR